MRLWKKILTLVLVVFAAVSCLFACGSDGKYDDMDIRIRNVKGLDDNYVINLSPLESENIFSFEVVVDGVDSDVDRSVSFVIDNPGIITLQKSEYNDANGVTAATFKAISDGTTIIHVNSNEGNVTEPVQVRVDVPVDTITFKNSVFAVVRGEEYTLSSDSLTYSPANTTQREVYYQVSPINEMGDDDRITEVNEHLTSTGKILVDTDLNYFFIDVYSAHKDSSNYEHRAIVNVLDKPDPVW